MHLTEIGAVLKNGIDRDPEQTTITCLSGLGIQDLTAVNQLWGNLILQSGVHNLRSKGQLLPK